MKLPRITLVAAHDIFMAVAAFEIAVWLRYLTYGAPQSLGVVWEGTVVFAVVSAIVFWTVGLYRGIWYYASLNDLLAIAKAVTLAVLVFLPVLFLLTRLENVPRTALFLTWPLLIVLLAAPRLLYRLIKDGNFRLVLERGDERSVPVLLAGAGDAAETFIRQMHRGAAAYRIVGIVDSNPGRVGREVRGVRVLGTFAEIDAVVARLETQYRRPQRLIIAGERADGAAVRALLDSADRLGMTLARLPRLTDFRRDPPASGDEGGNGARLDLRPVDVEDLLDRPQRVLDRTAMARLVAGRRVLVTGAGGTIGSELVRQIAGLEPARLALLDNGEYNLYAIDLELGESHPALPRAAVLADVREGARLAEVFRTERPELVFHAAAFKHVPLAEANPAEAVLTNTFGTREVAEASRAHGVETMVMISTDKAVHPSSIMGASKRIAELICQALSAAPAGRGTRFITVRFGNVLGSTGSVVPLFERQLARGGPVTLTHPDAARYFMTTREAVELVLHASAMPEQARERGKVFVLDMGQPVKIGDLARQMIKLAGLNPDDIAVTHIGLRPGEKLTEELFYAAEELVPTPVDGVLMAAPRMIDYELLAAELERLRAAARAGDAAETLERVALLVPEYQTAVAPEPRRAVSD